MKGTSIYDPDFGLYIDTYSAQRTGYLGVNSGLNSIAHYGGQYTKSWMHSTTVSYGASDHLGWSKSYQKAYDKKVAFEKLNKLLKDLKEYSDYLKDGTSNDLSTDGETTPGFYHNKFNQELIKFLDNNVKVICQGTHDSNTLCDAAQKRTKR